VCWVEEAVQSEQGKEKSEGRTLDLLSLGVLGAALFSGVEPEVLEEEDLAVLAVLNSLLGGVSDAVVEEGDGLGEELLKLLGLFVYTSTCGSGEWQASDDGPQTGCSVRG
jgi:hypothetical protein